DGWYDAIGDVEASSQVSNAVLDALNDDLNTPAALSELHRLEHSEDAAFRQNRHREEAEGRRGDPGEPPQLGSARNDGDGSIDLRRPQAAQLLKTSANLLGLLQQTRSERQAGALSEAEIDAA